MSALQETAPTGMAMTRLMKIRRKSELTCSHSRQMQVIRKYVTAASAILMATAAIFLCREISIFFITDTRLIGFVLQI